MAFLLTADQRVRVSARVTDNYGNPVSLDATPTFSISNPDIIRLEPIDGDAFAVSCVAVGPIGMSTLSASMGGISSEPLDIEVVAGGAIRIDLVADTPEPK